MSETTTDKPASESTEVTFLDTTGDGIPDGVITRRLIDLDPLVGRAGRLRGIVETTALDIGIDGVPKELRIRETVLGSRPVGADEILSTVEFEVDPRDAEIVQVVLAAKGA